MQIQELTEYNFYYEMDMNHEPLDVPGHNNMVSVMVPQMPCDKGWHYLERWSFVCDPYVIGNQSQRGL